VVDDVDVDDVDVDDVDVVVVVIAAQLSMSILHARLAADQTHLQLPAQPPGVVVVEVVVVEVVVVEVVPDCP